MIQGDVKVCFSVVLVVVAVGLMGSVFETGSHFVALADLELTK